MGKKPAYTEELYSTLKEDKSIADLIPDTIEDFSSSLQDEKYARDFHSAISEYYGADTMPEVDDFLLRVKKKPGLLASSNGSKPSPPDVLWKGGAQEVTPGPETKPAPKPEPTFEDKFSISRSRLKRTEPVEPASAEEVGPTTISPVTGETIEDVEASMKSGPMMAEPPEPPEIPVDQKRQALLDVYESRQEAKRLQRIEEKKNEVQWLALPKAMWHTLYYQIIPSTIATMSTMPVTRGERFDIPSEERQLPEFDAKGAEIAGQQFYQDQVAKGEVFSEDLVKSVGEITGPVSMINYVSYVTGQSAAQIIPAIFTYGATGGTQAFQAIYSQAIQDIAQQEGITPAEVIRLGKASKVKAAIGGIISGGLEYVGAKGFTKELGKGAQKVLAANKEGLTEWGQTAVEQQFTGMAAGKSIKESFQTKVATPQAAAERAEGYYAGTIGGGVMSTVAGEGAERTVKAPKEDPGKKPEKPAAPSPATVDVTAPSPATVDVTAKPGEQVKESVVPAQTRVKEAKVVTDKESLSKVYQEDFKMTPEQASVAAEISDKILEQISLRYGQTKQEAYETIGWANSSTDEFIEEAKKQGILFSKTETGLAPSLSVFESRTAKQLEGKEVDASQIESMLNQAGVKQVEKDLAREAMKDMVDMKIPFKEFKQRVGALIMPLAKTRVNTYAALLRESIKNAAAEGRKFVRIPMPKTLAAIEGFINTKIDDEYFVVKGNETGRLFAGDIIKDNLDLDTDVIHVVIKSSPNEFIAINSDMTEEISIEKLIGQKYGDPNQTLNEKTGLIKNALEKEYQDKKKEFSYIPILDNNGNIDRKRAPEKIIIWDEINNDYDYASSYNQPNVVIAAKQRSGPEWRSMLEPKHESILKKYDDLIKSFKKERPDAREVQDKSGNGWIETSITPEDDKKPLIAFQRTADAIYHGAIKKMPDGKAFIYALSDPTITTPLHELAHLYEEVLTDNEIAVIEAWSGFKAGTIEFSEAFAKGFERYLAEGTVRDAKMDGIFAQFREFLTGLIDKIKSMGKPLNPQMEAIYQQMTGQDARKADETTRMTAEIVVAPSFEQHQKTARSEGYTEAVVKQAASEPATPPAMQYVPAPAESTPAFVTSEGAKAVADHFRSLPEPNRPKTAYEVLKMISSLPYNGEKVNSVQALAIMQELIASGNIRRSGNNVKVLFSSTPDKAEQQRKRDEDTKNTMRRVAQDKVADPEKGYIAPMLERAKQRSGKMGAAIASAQKNALEIIAGSFVNFFKAFRGNYDWSTTSGTLKNLSDLSFRLTAGVLIGTPLTLVESAFRASGLTYLWDNFARPGIKAGSDWVAGKLKSGVQSQNIALRNFASSLQGILKTATYTAADLSRLGSFKGNVKFAAHVAMDHMNKMYDIVDSDPAALNNVHKAMDPEVYYYDEPDKFRDSKGAPIEKWTDLSIEQQREYRQKFIDGLNEKEKSLYDALTTSSQYAHDWYFANGIISFETYEKFYGQYIARQYEQHLSQATEPDVHRLKNNSSISMDYLTRRKDYHDMKKAAQKKGEGAKGELVVIYDPVYLVGLRMAQMLQIQAVREYSEQIYSDASIVKSNEPRSGFIQLNGSIYGILSGSYVPRYVAEDFKGYIYLSELVNKMNSAFSTYDGIAMRKWLKKGMTVYNPVTIFGNNVSNFHFAFMAGVDGFNFVANLDKAKDERENKGVFYSDLLMAGLLDSEIILNTIKERTREILGMPKTEDEKNLFQKIDDMMTNFYRRIDDNAKVAAYMTMRVNYGMSKEESISRIRDSFQNYDLVGRLFDFASKTPITGNPFIKFKGDFIRIFKNAMVNRPLHMIAYYAMMKALLQNMWGWADDEEEDEEMMLTKQASRRRPFVQRVPFFDIPLEFEMGYTRINVAKFVSPFYLYDTPEDRQGASGFVNSLSEFMPYQTVTNENGVPEPKVQDVLLGPAIEIIRDKDFRGMSVRNPRGYATTNEQAFNLLEHLVRAYVPVAGSLASDLYRVDAEGLDKFGRSKTWAKVLLSRMVKIEEYNSEDAVNFLEKEALNDVYKAEKLIREFSILRSRALNDIQRIQEKKDLSEENKQKNIARIEKSIEEYRNNLINEIDSIQLRYDQPDSPVGILTALEKAILKRKMEEATK